ncbi:MAG: hypothetical protein V1780_05085, partial [Chloroflexota bacterium]
MTMTKSCPGSRTIREPVPDEIKCPQCGGEVEIWTDELKATCPNCGHKVFREARVSCIDWCPHAQECVGPEVYQRLKPGGEAELAEATRKTVQEILEERFGAKGSAYFDSVISDVLGLGP